MGVIITPESDLGKELAKWEQHHTPYIGHGQKPGNPYVYRPFPKMVYRAVKKPNGKVVCMEPLPQPVGFRDTNDYLIALNQAEAIKKQCFRIVQSEDEYLVAKGQGWCDDPIAALAQFEREEQAFGNAAAEAAFAAQRMSEKARAEFTAAQDDTIAHVADVVAAPKTRRWARAANADEA